MTKQTLIAFRDFIGSQTHINYLAVELLEQLEGEIYNFREQKTIPGPEQAKLCCLILTIEEGKLLKEITGRGASSIFHSMSPFQHDRWNKIVSLKQRIEKLLTD